MQRERSSYTYTYELLMSIYIYIYTNMFCYLLWKPIGRKYLYFVGSNNENS